MGNIKLFLMDLKRGFLENPACFLFPLVIASVLSVEVSSKAEVVREFVGSQEVAFGDLFFYAYGGMEEYIPKPSNPFVFPVVWMLVFGMSAFIVLNWPIRDLEGIGQYMMVQVNSKYKWWLSKCVWNIAATLIFHLTICIVFLLCCLIQDFSMSMKIDLYFVVGLLEAMSGEYEKTGMECVTMVMCIAPILFSVALNMLQMMLSLFIKPIYSYMVILGILLVSSYFLSPFAVGNYAMLLRYKDILEKGVSPMVGILISMMILLCSILIGVWKMYRLDILKKE